MSQAVLDALTSKFGDAILSTQSKYQDESVTVAPAKLVEVCTFLKDDDKMAFDSPVFLTCTDHMGLPDEKHRFEVVVQLRSTTKKHRIRIKVPLEEGKLKVPTLSGLWVGFNWLERETYDMYGVEFEGHPDMRRIYMYDEFEGFPLRKDFPKDRRFPLARREWTDE
jgi:NADH-quinone oxidoreductase subunit C